MKLSNDQIEQILEGAPCTDEAYQHEIDDYIATCVEMECVVVGDLLREILTLRQRVQELERDWNSEHYHRRAVDDENERLKAQQSEVAARAVEGFSHKFKGDDSEWVTYHAFRSAAYGYANQLRENGL